MPTRLTCRAVLAGNFVCGLVAFASRAPEVKVPAAPQGYTWSAVVRGGRSEP